MQQQVLDILPNGHPNKTACLNNLGLSLRERFRFLGSVTDINVAISLQQQAIALTPNQHPNLPGYLSNLGNALHDRFKQLKEQTDLDQAIILQQRAVDITSSRDPGRGKLLNNIGNSLTSRFNVLGNQDDIDKAISFLQEATALTPFGHPDKARFLTSLGSSWEERFARLHNIPDIEEAITIHKQAVFLTTMNFSDRARKLTNLGNSLHQRFKHLHDLDDINNAIILQREAQLINLLPDGDPKKPGYLNCHALSLLYRFKHFRNLSDVIEAILIQQKAIELTSEGHVDRPGLLSNLGNSFRQRFEYLGDVVDIDSAIQAQRQAVELTEDVNQDKPSFISNLANSLSRRFEYLRERSDIDEAVAAQQYAVDLCPNGHNRKAIFYNSLGISLCIWFRQVKEHADIDRAITAHLNAMELIPKGGTEKTGLLFNLANSLLTRFDSLQELGDINKAISFCQRAVDLTPDIHASKAILLSSLGLMFSARFQLLQELTDLDKAISMQQQALNLIPDGHSDEALIYGNLAVSLSHRFDLLQKAEDMDKAIGAFRVATKSHAGNSVAQYTFALNWASLCLRAGNPSLSLEAYSAILEMIPQLAWVGHKVARRYSELSKIGSIVNKAAAVAISLGKENLALEWLEEGRNIVWQQILQLRNPADELRLRDPELADKLQVISFALEAVGSSSNDRRMQIIDLKTQSLNTEGDAQRHRALAAEYKTIINQIRQLEGFESFLRPKKLSELLPAASNGPVVVINMHSSRCDALVLQTFDSSQPVIHIPLPEFSFEKAKQLYFQKNTILHEQSTRYDRKLVTVTDSMTHGVSSLQSVLADLWICVVSPILEKIQKTLTKRDNDHLPHLTWCATGPLAFLPLHAAGIYGNDSLNHPKVKISDYFISSYCPTLSSLLRHPLKHDACKLHSNILIVSQPNTGQPLPGTIQEVQSIMKHAPPDHILHLNDKQATINMVLEEMEQHDWIHLACHGIQNIRDPLKSAFALSDGMLQLESLLGKSFHHAEVAFLSACQTATGDAHLPEEAIHLAAGMLTAGFRNVVGTMWSIKDKDAPLVADIFYSTLLQESRRKDGSLNVAYALHKAVEKLRETVGERSFERWVPFIHFGL
ncbi:hypothetical protein M422DRAFT_187563 [Sphaerobolus stellatus SS14]|uniref:Unplaced genomic scaffold SPHSTscaffold_193, whole genome shotgun sequence n=1 Tax=Sphaerobolus stellatus (strain SS14) TaxID=990650 RepID=A0A0C9UXK3_SPHS4|nr:hypothetical protein M422DRAFT_187563 [Sphaerobolus stellatus SS14]